MMSSLNFSPYMPDVTHRQPLSSVGVGDQATSRKFSQDSTNNETDMESDLCVRFHKDKEYSFDLLEDSSPLSYHFSASQSDQYMSVTTNQSSVSSKALRAKSILPTRLSNIYVRKNLKICDTNFDNLYDVSSDEEIPKNKNLGLKVKTQKLSQMCRSSAISDSKIENFVRPELPRSFNTQVPLFHKPLSLNINPCPNKMVQISSFSNPDFDSNREIRHQSWEGGVQLDPAAMDTLEVFSGLKSCDNSPERALQPCSTDLEKQHSPSQIFSYYSQENSVAFSPGQQRDQNYLPRLDIPSPVRFFSTVLSPGTRHTWHFDLPSSTTAENFYKSFFEQDVVKNEVGTLEMTVHESDLTSNQSGTEYLNLGNSRYQASKSLYNLRTNSDEVISPETRTCYETNDITTSNLERTSFWVDFQQSFTSEPLNSIGEQDQKNLALHQTMKDVKDKRTDIGPLILKSEHLIPEIERSQETTCSSSDTECLESIFYRAFQRLLLNSSYFDAYIHRIPRYEALQSQRVSFTVSHRAQLLGQFELSDAPMGAKSQLLSYISKGIEIVPHNLERLKRDLEDEALWQISPTTWSINAFKFLNGGHLLAAPISEHLRSFHIGYNSNGSICDPVRILDLGGQEVCDWAWHCATEYPETQVYTVTAKSHRQKSTSKFRGPDNHHRIFVENIEFLPFQDDQFDLISARSIYSFLTTQTQNSRDEWDNCLEECFRVLKPGGYLEFNIMDSKISNAGPLGLAKSQEFSNRLMDLGYDPQPTKKWLSRLKSAGFVDTQRAWLFLPMGASLKNQVLQSNDDDIAAKDNSEDKILGNTEDVATVCGLVGSWAWERWILRCEMQNERIGKMYDGIQDIFLEGSKCGAGWRSITGWAKKPSNIS